MYVLVCVCKAKEIWLDSTIYRSPGSCDVAAYFAHSYGASDDGIDDGDSTGVAVVDIVPVMMATAIYTSHLV